MLTPYIDDEGLLRVHGRIDAASSLPYNTRRPIILPHSHVFTKLVTTPLPTTLYVERFGVISYSMTCRLMKAKPRAPLMGQLPKDRLTPCARPFQYTGVDYFGPLTVSIGRRTEKRWVALFTCLSVRAIHSINRLIAL
uniref:Uncharacterized protein n=1 Tax=Musca domestica TaxID=7370 RepID=A0A1I8NL07_MUSDO